MKVGLQNPVGNQEIVNEDVFEIIIYKVKNYLRYWPFFLVSVAICLTLGYFHIRSTVPIYTVFAKMLIVRESSSQQVKQDNQAAVNPMEVDDELEILRSRTIMEQVVQDLQLWTSYQEINAQGNIDLYKESPVQFVLLKADQDLGGQYLELIIKDEQTFDLKQPNSYGSFQYGSVIKSNFGTWKLNSTTYLKEHIGKSILIYLSNTENMTDWYMSSFSATLSADQSSVVQLSIKDTKPERGADIINSTIKAYNLSTIAYRNKVNQSTLSFLNDRIDTITAELVSVEKRVEKYKSTRGITDLSAESNAYLDNVKANDSRLNEVNVQLQIINEIQKYINSPLSDGNAPAISGISDPGLVALIEQLISLEGRKDRLLATTPAANPVFIPINQQIKKTKNSIRENIKGIRRAYVATKHQLQKYNSRFESSIKKLPGKERAFITIKRQQSIKEELYIYLLQKREEAGMENASKLLDSRIIDQAHYGAPDTHNSNFTYALAFVFGLAFPAGLIFAKDALNNKITSIKDIEYKISVPVIGELSRQKMKPVILIPQDSRTMISEQFRLLRTKLSIINGKSNVGNVTMLTSGIPGEGKSMIARNLAAVMSAAGRKTVLIDADLRKPQLATLFKVSEEIGLTDFLEGTSFMQDIVQKSNIHPNLFVITAGSKTNNPSELLEKHELTDLFEWLRIYFDEIIVDTPPIQLVTDAMVITKIADSNLFVVRQDYTYKAQIKFINQMSLDGVFKNLHIVFNCASTDRTYNYPQKYAKHYYEPEATKFRLPFQRRS